MDTFIFIIISSLCEVYIFEVVIDKKGVEPVLVKTFIIKWLALEVFLQRIG